ncbi:MAG: class I SAM-dependent methyltransferase [Coriobacteriales bacterium]|nr:class I SAM-dependent methyltransferase [Coriobacteriales bacterium]
MDEEEKRFYQNAKFPEGEGGVRMLERMNEGHHEQLAAWGFAQLSPQPGAQILDVGCGGGANLLRLLERSPLGTVTGVDYSQTSVEMSEKTCAEAIQKGRCRVQLADVADLPFKDRSFDFVSAFETIYFWPDIVRSLAEVRRVLKPGGTFMVCNEADGTHAEDFRMGDVIDGMTVYAPDELEGLLEKAGFDSVRIYRDEPRSFIVFEATKER